MRAVLLSLLAAGVAMFAPGCSGSSAPQAPLAVALSGVRSAPQFVPVKKTKPHASSVIVVIMENRDYDLVIGSSDAPYINNTLVPEAALMTNSHAIGHPSQPNYLALFSGSTQGVTDDSCPHNFGATNLGNQLLSVSKTFAGYSESMPSNGYTGCTSGEYARKHNPWVDFTDLPASTNLVYGGLPSTVPLVWFVVPNLCDDMHDCSTQMGDTWLSKNLPPILSYNASNGGLLILTWDEADPDSNGTNQIPTLLIGPSIVPGRYSQDVNHYNVLRTIEKIAGLPCIGNACKAKLLTGMWQ